MKKLEEIKNGRKLKEFSDNELRELCDEIREFLVSSVSKTGGHLASNLGVVEATVAMHSVFDFPSDKLIFDVGHQSYVHKLLTGRMDLFDTLRKHNGISGFPKANESEYDVFNSGHSSNSISVALGLKRALELSEDEKTKKSVKSKVVAFIGDGALTGGMAYEALNDAGRSNSNIIIILNDNEMSISENVGGIALHLAKIRTNRKYLILKSKISNFVKHIPIIGSIIYKAVSNLKRPLRNIVTGRRNNIFEALGFYYAGPFDGHNVVDLKEELLAISTLKKPCVVHIVTKKGMGYKYAEESPDLYHGVKQFDREHKLEKKTGTDFSSVFGKKLVDLAEKNHKIAAITAAMPDGTGLCLFKEKFPERYYDVAIAEGHAVGLSAGLSIGGMVSVFAVYSAFLTRGFDQLLTDVCGMKLHVVFCVDRSGLVGEDGETHHGVFDIAYLNLMPGITVMSPASFHELSCMLEDAIEKYNSPVVIRYPKGSEKEIVTKYEKLRNCCYQDKKAQVLTEGKDITIISDGPMCADALIAAEKLLEKGILAEVINLRFIKPLDEETVLKSVQKTGKCAVLEDGGFYGGIHTVISSITGMKVLGINTGDKFVSHGSVEELKKELKMDGESVCERIIKEYF